MLPCKPRTSTPGRWLVLLLGLLSASLVWAQADPPGRVARLNHLEGGASFALDGSGTWTPAEFNRPLTSGDHVATDPASRAEVQSGSTTLHLDGSSWLVITELDDATTHLELREGTLAMRISALFPGEHYEVSTANLSFVASTPGDYRFDVDPARGTTRVTLQNGSGVVYGENAEARTLAAPQQIVFQGRQLAYLQSVAEAPRDSFDLWVTVRNYRAEQAVSARYVSPETVGYQQLDAWGVWIIDPFYGPVWQPRVSIADWAPYRYGHWVWIAPWGWTWVDDAPWGFAPFHYGRWIQLGLHWTWVPGPLAPRPVYAPALVGFIGISGVSGDVSWSLSIGSGGIGVGIGWFPLAPGEVWRPAYPASARYLEPINRWPRHRDEPHPPSLYRYQRQPDALTIVPAGDFGQRHRYQNRNYSSMRPALPESALARTQALPLPPRTVGRIPIQGDVRPAVPPLSAPAAPPPAARGQPPGPRVLPPTGQPGPALRPQPPAPARESRRQREQQQERSRMPDARRVPPPPLGREATPMAPRPAQPGEPGPAPRPRVAPPLAPTARQPATREPARQPAERRSPGDARPAPDPNAVRPLTQPR